MRGMKKTVFILLALFYLSGVVAGEACAISITDGARKYKLDNGLNIILKEDHSAPVVAIQVWVKTGSANEREDEAGITHFIEHMIFKGTPTKKKGEIGYIIESSGGDINAYTSYDRTVYFLEIASGHFVKALDVLLDAVQNSLFDSSDLEKEKEVVLEEYRRSLDLPTKRLSWAMADLSYPDHPYGRPIIGSESTIRSFKRPQILDYIERRYCGDNMVLVMVGDFDSGDALNAIRDITKDFPKRSCSPNKTMEEIPQDSPRSVILKGDVQKVYMDMSWHIPSITHPDIPALDILEIIMGEGKSSRLYTSLKMGNNLVRDVGVTSYAMAEAGLFSIESIFGNEKMDRVLEMIAGEIKRLGVEPVDTAELTKAKRIAEAGFLTAMDTMKGQARALGYFETMKGDMYEADEYLEQLDRVTSEDIIDVARQYLRPDNLSIGLMVPRESDISLSEDQIIKIFNGSVMDREKTAYDPGGKDNQGTKKILMPNGMRVIVSENRRLPLVSIRGVFLGGSRFEDTEHSGISGIVARMLTRGTRHLFAPEIASLIESWPGEIQGFSGRNSFGVSADLLSRDLYSCIELLADMILNPSFPEDEIIKVKEDTLSDIKMKNDRPVQMLSDYFDKTLYSSHPYGMPLSGTIESVNSMHRSDIKKWYESLAIPDNFVLSVTGDVSKDLFIKRVEELFRDFESRTFSPPGILPEPPIKEARELHIERAGNQVHIMIGYLGEIINGQDDAAMAIIDAALSGTSGRLFIELREKQGLAYSVYSFRRPGLETGMFGVYLACDPEKLRIAKESIFNELNKMRDEGLTNRELEDAKRYITGKDAINSQTNQSGAMRMALDEIYGLGYEHKKEYIKRIQAVTVEDILRAAKRIIHPDHYVLVTLGPGS